MLKTFSFAERKRSCCCCWMMLVTFSFCFFLALFVFLYFHKRQLHFNENEIDGKVFSVNWATSMTFPSSFCYHYFFPLFIEAWNVKERERKPRGSLAERSSCVCIYIKQDWHRISIYSCCVYFSLLSHLSDMKTLSLSFGFSPFLFSSSIKREMLA